MSIKIAKLKIRALDHELRQKMIANIKEKPGITVTELYRIMSIEQSVASQHLKILQDAGIVYYEADGKFHLFYVDNSELQRLYDLCKQMAA